MILFKDYKNFASKDETRQDLHFAHVIGRQMYITDGHRMLVAESNECDSVLDVKTLFRLASRIPKAKLPGIVPKYTPGNSIEVKTTIPAIFGCLKTTRPSDKLKVYLDVTGTWTLVPKHALDGVTLAGDSIIAFNPTFFREIAGMEVTIQLSSEHTSGHAALIRISDLQKLVIMPRRF